MSTAINITQNGEEKSLSESTANASSNEMPLIRLCTKCNENIATEKHQWCKSCKAKYQREYTALVPEMSEAKGYARGVTALRKFLVGEFERLGSGTFSGYEIAELIRQAKVEQV